MEPGAQSHRFNTGVEGTSGDDPGQAPAQAGGTGTCQVGLFPGMDVPTATTALLSWPLFLQVRCSQPVDYKCHASLHFKQ